MAMPMPLVSRADAERLAAEADRYRSTAEFYGVPPATYAADQRHASPPATYAADQRHANPPATYAADQRHANDVPMQTYPARPATYSADRTPPATYSADRGDRQAAQRESGQNSPKRSTGDAVASGIDSALETLKPFVDVVDDVLETFGMGNIKPQPKKRPPQDPFKPIRWKSDNGTFYSLSRQPDTLYPPPEPTRPSSRRRGSEGSTASYQTIPPSLPVATSFVGPLTMLPPQPSPVLPPAPPSPMLPPSPRVVPASQNLVHPVHGLPASVGPTYVNNGLRSSDTVVVPPPSLARSRSGSRNPLPIGTTFVEGHLGVPASPYMSTPRREVVVSTPRRDMVHSETCQYDTNVQPITVQSGGFPLRDNSARVKNARGYSPARTVVQPAPGYLVDSRPLVASPIVTTHAPPPRLRRHYEDLDYHDEVLRRWDDSSTEDEAILRELQTRVDLLRERARNGPLSEAPQASRPILTKRSRPSTPTPTPYSAETVSIYEPVPNYVATGPAAQLQAAPPMMHSTSSTPLAPPVQDEQARIRNINTQAQENVLRCNRLRERIENNAGSQPGVHQQHPGMPMVWSPQTQASNTFPAPAHPSTPLQTRPALRGQLGGASTGASSAASSRASSRSTTPIRLRPAIKPGAGILTPRGGGGVLTPRHQARTDGIDEFAGGRGGLQWPLWDKDLIVQNDGIAMNQRVSGNLTPQLVRFSPQDTMLSYRRENSGESAEFPPHYVVSNGEFVAAPYDTGLTRGLNQAELDQLGHGGSISSATASDQFVEVRIQNASYSFPSNYPTEEEVKIRNMSDSLVHEQQDQELQQRMSHCLELVDLLEHQRPLYQASALPADFQNAVSVLSQELEAVGNEALEQGWGVPGALHLFEQRNELLDRVAALLDPNFTKAAVRSRSSRSRSGASTPQKPVEESATPQKTAVPSPGQTASTTPPSTAPPPTTPQSAASASASNAVSSTTQRAACPPLESALKSTDARSASDFRDDAPGYRLRRSEPVRERVVGDNLSSAYSDAGSSASKPSRSPPRPADPQCASCFAGFSRSERTKVFV